MTVDKQHVKFLKTQAARARRNLNTKQAISALTALIDVHTKSAQYDEALRNIEELLGFLKKIKDNTLSGDLFLKKGKLLQQFGKSAEAEAEFLKAADYFKNAGDTVRENDALIELAILYSFLGKYTDSLQIFHRLREFFTAENDLRQLAFILGRIGHLYTEQEDYAQGLALNREALQISRSINDKKGIWECLWGISFIYLERRHHESAAGIIDEMESVSEALNVEHFKAGTLCAKGMLLALRGDFKNALQCQHQALEIARQPNAQRNEALILRFLGQTYILMGTYDEAVAVLKNSLQITEQHGLLRMQFLAHQQLAIAYEHCGNCEPAYEHFKMFVAIQNDVRGNVRQHELTQMRLSIEQTKNHYEKEILRLRAANAEKELQQKNHELQTLGAQIARQQEILEKIRHDVQAIERLSSERRSTLLPSRELGKKLSSLLKSGNGLAQFERRFDAVHGEFLKNLSEKFPALTPTELKVCTLLRTNLTTKEIAHLLCISVATVDLHRSHIRKKMSISHDQNLTTVLASF
jgi:tetratricopeptide (TPR) repeat protein/DNA-binding CsgD family transcriptional regulator